MRIREKGKARATTFDEYLAGLSAPKRAALERLAEIVRSLAPSAEKCLSYGVPAFRHHGRILVGFGASANHCSFYPMSGSTIAAHADALAGFETSKGAIRFVPERPLSAVLVRKLVRSCIADNAVRAAGKGLTAKRAAPTSSKGGTGTKRKTRVRGASSPANEAPSVADVLRWLERKGSKRNREGMARYAITSEHVFGVSVGALRTYAKRIGPTHSLAIHLWDTGHHEARMLAAFVDEPERVSVAQMQRWCAGFDNWAICDTVCFSLFDRTPHVFEMVERWASDEREFVRRGAFALLASAALHRRDEEDAPFERCLPLIESCASDGRNFVKKGVSWALRGVGRRSDSLHRQAIVLARRLAASPHAAARWVGKDALRDLTRTRA
jgi:3-methyladenine DNA glycosylase AlkD/uncharacterized protein YdhG (YjbR/CyaY superfamily)